MGLWLVETIAISLSGTHILHSTPYISVSEMSFMLDRTYSK
jgi:hypothetical protein